MCPRVTSSVNIARPNVAAISRCRSKRRRSLKTTNSSAGSCLHDRATIFKEDGDWYLLVHTTCEHLQADNRCGIYETRPTICREYTTKECEYDDDWTYDFYLETADQVAEYTEAILPKKAQKHPQPEAVAVANLGVTNR